jgi:23S rRNA pseudouridine1911/1915/1917 synthase
VRGSLTRGRAEDSLAFIMHPSPRAPRPIAKASVAEGGDSSSGEGELNRGYEYGERLGDRATGLGASAYLATRYPHSTEAEWRERIAAGQVLLDGSPMGPHAILRAGGVLVWRRPPWREPPVPLTFAVLHRDPQVLAVLKPSGLPTVPGGGFLEHTLLQRVRRSYPGVSPLHRLGRATTGVVLFARTGEAARSLAAAWRQGEVRKVYRALVQGAPLDDTFAVEAPIGRIPHPALGTVHAAEPRGKPSRSLVQVLQRREGSSLVEVEIATGRPHQIRIHLAAAGHPLEGDPFYGPGGVPLGGSGALPGDPGYLLHARLLAFPHPATGATVTVEAPPPPALCDSMGS